MVKLQGYYMGGITVALHGGVALAQHGQVAMTLHNYPSMGGRG